MSLEVEMRRLLRDEGMNEVLLLFARVMDERLKAIEDRLEDLAARLRRYGPVPP